MSSDKKNIQRFEDFPPPPFENVSTEKELSLKKKILHGLPKCDLTEKVFLRRK